MRPIALSSGQYVRANSLVDDRDAADRRANRCQRTARPFEHADAERREVAGRDVGAVDRRARLVRRLLTAGHGNGRAVEVEREGQPRGERDALTPGSASIRRSNSSRTAGCVPACSAACPCRPEQSPGRRCAKPTCAFLRRREAAQQQPGEDEEHDGHRDLADDQDVARRPAAAGEAFVRRVSPLRIGDEVGAGGAERRGQAGEHAGEERRWR